MSSRRIRPPRRQRGLALLVFLALFAIAAAFMLVSSLNQGSTALALARSSSNRAAMQQAKAALIAWAASEAAQPASGQGFQPGALPCPDITNDGVSDYTGAVCTRRLGRLPYKTLGVSDLRDASGEILWYAVSSNFVRSTSNVINSDKLGGITITGLAPAANVIAVVLAPGMRLGNQDRSPGGTLCNAAGQACNIASNYLEGINGDANYDDYITAMENLTDPVAANQINDQLLAITQSDLMSVVESVVAARIQRDIVAQYIYNSDPTLTDGGNVWSDNSANRDKSRYFDAWGGFPFAAPFTNPGTSNFTGQDATPGPAIYEGLMPVVNNLNYTWSTGGVVQTGGSGTVWAGSSCAPASFNTQMRCNIWYNSGAPRISISGTVANVGRSFVQLTQLSDVSCSGCGLSSRTLTGSLDSAGNGIVTLVATMSNVFVWTNVTVTIDNSSLVTSALLSTTSTDIAGWFNNNQWYKVTYYAISTGYAPGGGGACTAGGTCLTVNNLTTTPTNDKQAILILAGRSLAGIARPNATFSDYLEGQNASTGDRIFEHGLGDMTSTGSAINDKVAVVAP